MWRALLLIVMGLNGVARAGEIPSALRELRPHFMFGVGSGPSDGWVDENRKQGALWDVRYLYLCGGVNTPSNWKTWNQPAGAFLSIFLNDNARGGTIPCVTYYQMLQSLPGQGGEAGANRNNAQNASTMRAYFDDLKVLFQRCGEFGKPVILHHEPDLWGYFLIAKEFAPNDADSVRVMVKSSGQEDVQEFEDSAAGFGKAIVALRDKYAPRVILAWHASKWGQPDTKKTSEFIKKCGKWDLLFTDFSDRDAGWKIAKNYMPGGAWWNDGDFVGYRAWIAEIHAQTGLSVMAWQVPMGNTIMATCDNTEGHYMDNRAQYFLENYPENTHLQEYRAAGFIGMLFGGGAGGCTSAGDARRDGVTNPSPIANNKGEKSVWPDDDGGYLRTRMANYFAKGALPLWSKPKPPERTERATPVVVAKKAEVLVPEDVLREFQAALVAQAGAALKDGRKPSVFMKLMGPLEKFEIAKADANDLHVKVQGSGLPVAWNRVDAAAKLSLAKSMLNDERVQTFLVAAVFAFAAGNPDDGEDLLARAAIKDAKAAQDLRARLK